MEDGAIAQVADQTTYFDVARLADDNGVSPLGHETSQGAMSACHQRAGGVVDGEAALVQIQTDAIGDAVGGEQHRGRTDVFLAVDADSAGGVDLGHHVGIMHEITEDGERSLLRQLQGEIDGVAHAKTHAEMFSHAYLHDGAFLFPLRRASPVSENRPWMFRLTWRASGSVPAAALLHDSFQMIEVIGESLLAGAGELAARLRSATDELLVDGDVAFLFELLQVDAEIAVGHADGVAQLGEGQARRRRQRRHDGQAAALVQQRIEFVKETFERIHGEIPLKPLAA